jgi:transposase
VALAVRALDEARRRVQQDALGHRGHKHDPLYRVRRLLRPGADRLSDDARTKLDAALQAGDPDLEVTVAWHCYQQLRATYHHPNPQQGADRQRRCSTSCPAARSPRSPASAACCARGPSSSPTSTPAA